MNYERETKDNIVLRPLLLASSNRNHTNVFFINLAKLGKKLRSTLINTGGLKVHWIWQLIFVNIMEI